MSRKLSKNSYGNGQNYSTDHSQRQQSPSSYSDSGEEIQSRNSAQRAVQRVQVPPRKTELCRNYEQQGYCKFGEQCSFAHGKCELTSRRSVHYQLKNKPCKRYFQGHCCFGEKCQYIHGEVIDLGEHREFVEKVFRENKLMVPLHPSKKINILAKLEQNERFDVQRFHHLYKIFGRKLNFKRDDLYINVFRKRLSYFESLSNMQDFEQLMQNSRKASEQC